MAYLRILKKAMGAETLVRGMKRGVDFFERKISWAVSFWRGKLVRGGRNFFEGKKRSRSFLEEKKRVVSFFQELKGAGSFLRKRKGVGSSFKEKRGSGVFLE